MYSLIIVDYNSMEATMEYIERCKQYLGMAASHVVIVENGDHTGATERLSQRYGACHVKCLTGISQQVCCFEKDGQQIAYCASGDNLGYAKGNNLGVMIADKLWNDPYYIISNNDLVFARPMDMALISRLFDEDPTVGIIGPAVITPQGQRQSPRCWQSAAHRLIANYWISAFGGLLGEKRRRGLWERYCKDVLEDAQTGYCPWISGCFFFARAEAFHRAGMFDAHTFLYAEEMILAKRLEAVGSRVFFCREAEVVHNHAQSTQKALAVFRMTEIDFAANYYFYREYMHTPKALLALAKGSFWVFTALFKLKQVLKGHRNENGGTAR